VGPKADEDRIPGIDVALADGETWDFGGLTMHVFDTPGHTRGHITLWFPEADALFPGEYARPMLKQVIDVRPRSDNITLPVSHTVELQVSWSTD